MPFTCRGPRAGFFVVVDSTEIAKAFSSATTIPPIYRVNGQRTTCSGLTKVQGFDGTAEV